MSLNVLLISSVGYLAIMLFVYFGVTRASDFKNLPAEKQLAGKKRLKTIFIITTVLGLVQLVVFNK